MVKNNSDQNPIEPYSDINFDVVPSSIMRHLEAQGEIIELDEEDKEELGIEQHKRIPFTQGNFFGETRFLYYNDPLPLI